MKSASFCHEELCFACGSGAKIEMHHVKPKCAGGGDAPDNIIPLCFVCHSLVDRVPFDHWPWEDFQKALEAQIDGPSVIKRLTLKLISLNYRAGDLVNLRLENKRLRAALQDIARQPEGDEQSAQAVAREVLRDADD